MKNFVRTWIQSIKREVPLFFMLLFVLLFPSSYFFLINLDQIPNYIELLRFLSIAIVYSTLITIIIRLIHSKAMKFTVYVVFILLLAVNLFCGLSFALFLSPNMLLLLSETNSSEVSDFFQTYGFTYDTVRTIIGMSFFIALVLFGEKKRDLIAGYIEKLPKPLKSVIVYTYFLFFILGICSFSIYPSLFKCRSVEEVDRWVASYNRSLMDEVTTFLFSFQDLRLMGETLEIARKQTIDVINGDNGDNIVSSDSDSINVILIIGESFIKTHSSLYGYYLKTNPLLEREKSEGRLFTFDNVVSPYQYTSEAVRNMMSVNSVGENEQWYDCPYFPAVFKKAGFNVYFWDNQYVPAENTSFDFSLNAYIHDKEMSEMIYDGYQSQVSDYDGELISDFQNYQYEKGLGLKNLILFHLQGQHFMTEKRFPQEKAFLRFTADSINSHQPWINKKKSEIIANYDNCTLYNDSVIKSVINIFNSKVSVLLYVSDHGEHVYDIADTRGRTESEKHHSADMIRFLHDVPCVVWCSEKYKESHPDKVDRLRLSQERPLSLDLLSYLIMDLGGANSKWYNTKRDLISDDYHCPPRIVNGHINYDTLKENGQ